MQKNIILCFCLWGGISLFSITRLWEPVDKEFTINIYDLGLANIATNYSTFGQYTKD